MKRFLLSLLSVAVFVPAVCAQRATVKETIQEMTTYPFSDPDPVANPSQLYYPYFRFDGFTDNSVRQEWRVVELENDYIKVSMFPEVGGKIWGAVDKTSQKEFIYYNHVVKFRDIAMRGAWTSGGIEFNFGIIGHVPTTATPVDYIIKEKTDGSVSCYVASYELVTRTWWMVEVNLPKDKAYFSTRVTWYNASSIDQPYYQWMNAGYKADGNLEFCYPGTNYIGHWGDSHPFPIDEKGRDVAWYEKNDFGTDKSYHVLGYYNDFYGGYWHDEDFGSVHHSAYQDKLGMKIFLWGLSREGAIWEKLLTDTDGQYVELQSGRVYNQPSSPSARTPFKHPVFNPQATDSWVEYWYPVKGTKGLAKAGTIGALNVQKNKDGLKLYFSPLEKISSEVSIFDGDKLLRTIPLNADVLQTWEQSVSLKDIGNVKDLRVVVGDDELVYSEVLEDNKVNRPLELPADFDWDSVYGLYVQGEQLMNQKMYDKAGEFLQRSLDKDKYFVPALSCMASLRYRQGRYGEALEYCRTALSINTYDGKANYIYGLVNAAMGNYTDAKDGFSVAGYSSDTRSAAYAKLSGLFVREKNWVKAEEFAVKSLGYNNMNLDALQLLMVIYRNTGEWFKWEAVNASLTQALPLFHYAGFERYMRSNGEDHGFAGQIRNELTYETYIEMALWYEGIGCLEEAVELLAFADSYPIANYKAAYLLDKLGEKEKSMVLLEKANMQSPYLVFPFRAEIIETLDWAEELRPDWKLSYYKGLVYWANQDKEKAFELFGSCGDDTGYAPFYLSRASMKQGEDKLKDLMLAEQTEMSWRGGLALMEYYSAGNRWDDAVKVGEKYMKRYPGNYYVGLKYAKALCETGKYQVCLNLLSRLDVLPNEGSYSGRLIYREANLYRALEYLQKKNYKQASAAVEKSRLWPENLGVGQPYDEDMDDRLENYIQAMIFAAQGNNEKAGELYESVASYAVSDKYFLSADLLSALALKELGRGADADKMTASWSKYGGDKAAVWSKAVYSGNYGEAARLAAGRVAAEDVVAWERTYRDDNFEFLIKMFAEK